MKYGRTIRFVGFIVVALALEGCSSLSGSQVKPLVVPEAHIVMPLDAALSGEELRQALAGLLASERGQLTLRVVIQSVQNAKAFEVKRNLVALGVQPERIITVHNTQEQLYIARNVVVSPDCAKTIHANWMGDVSDSIEPLGACLQNTILADMVEDPGDLVMPKKMQGPSAIKAAQAVRKYEHGDDRNSSENQSNNSGEEQSNSGRGRNEKGSVQPSSEPEAPSDDETNEASGNVSQLDAVPADRSE